MRKSLRPLLKKIGLLSVALIVRWIIIFLYESIRCQFQQQVRYAYSRISFALKKKSDSNNDITLDSRKVISLLCPTRERLGYAKRLVKSVYMTAAIPERIEILFYVDSEDVCKDAYQILSERIKNKYKRLLRCEFFIAEPMSISKSWNILASKSKGDVLIMANDDQVYVDYGWDIYLDNEIKKFPDEIYCMWFNDGVVTDHYNSCIGPMVSRKWYATLGYFTPGIFEFWCNDSWIEDIAKKIGRAHYVSRVLVQHRHYVAGRSFFDKTYRCHVGNFERERDVELFYNTDRDREIEAEKLRKVTDKDRSKISGEKCK